MKFDEFKIDEKKKKKRKAKFAYAGLPYLGYYGGGYANDSGDASGDVSESRSDPLEMFMPDNDELDDLKSKYLPDWEMLDHKDLQAKYVAKDHRHAEEFIEWINMLSEKMDHFAEVTQDVAEVKVKTTTFDVKGLTLLDFQLAMMVDAYAEKNDIEQVRMSGNFGMHEGWSDKYKRSINCDNPKGFSQKAHCQGRKKK